MPAAGAIDRFGPPLGLPRAYSGHNAYAGWGTPPDDAGRVVVIGYSLIGAQRYLRDCRVAAHVDNEIGVDNDEQDGPILVCAGPREPWSTQWASLSHLG